MPKLFHIERNSKLDGYWHYVVLHVVQVTIGLSTDAV